MFVASLVQYIHLKTVSLSHVAYLKWNKNWSLIISNTMFQVTHVFKNYGKGVRYVRFVHGGKDTQFWAGWYGIRVTNSCVEICPAGGR